MVEAIIAGTIGPLINISQQITGNIPIGGIRRSIRPAAVPAGQVKLTIQGRAAWMHHSPHARSDSLFVAVFQLFLELLNREIDHLDGLLRASP